MTRFGSRSSPWSPRLVALPWFGSDVLIQFGINALLLAVLAQGWNIIGGYTGYASFGNSVFYGLGSYGVAIAMVQWHLPFAVGFVFGVVLARRLRVARSALPVLRLRGHYFAIATLALAQVMTRDRVQRRPGRPEHRPRPAAAQQRPPLLRALARSARRCDTHRVLARHAAVSASA